jgi:hypothetical protein
LTFQSLSREAGESPPNIDKMAVAGESNAGVGEDPEPDVAGAGRVARIPPHVRRGIRVAAGGYSVVLVLGATYGLVDAVWSELSPTATASIAILIAAPLALALLWSRLTGLKAFGVEVSLSQATAEIETQRIAGITTHPYFSGAQDLVDQLKQAIINPDTAVVEANLHGGDYWWSSRLYLFAALADDFSSIRQVVFVECGADRSFIGMATPSTVRSALAAGLPSLEVVYADVKKQAAPPSSMSPADRVATIVYQWTSRQFEYDGEQSAEERLPRVTKELLQDSLAKVGKRLTKDSIEWTGVPSPQILQTLLIDFDAQYVALLRGRDLDRIVDRLELAKRIAERALA